MSELLGMLLSLPSRERGLKWFIWVKGHDKDRVAPLAGAWIEILQNKEVDECTVGRSPRGSVD